MGFRICVVKDDLLKEDEGLRKVTMLLRPYSEQQFLITTNYSGPIDFQKRSTSPAPNRSRPLATYNKYIDPIFRQARIGIGLAKIRPSPDFVVFFTGTSGMAFVAFIAKVLDIRSIKMITGDTITPSHRLDGHQQIAFSIMINSLNRLMLRLADRIIIESPSVLKGYPYLNERGVANKPKSVIPLYVEADKFRSTAPPSERRNMIGYIGRMSEEKGVRNLVKAIPKIIEGKKDARFILIGAGPLKEEMEALVKANNLEDCVEFVGWVDHDQIPSYLNSFKLMVLPSFSEGLPNVLLEAMACGTPVLATAVGGVPDVIENGKTGFLLKDNSPENIAQSVIKILSDPMLDLVGERGKEKVVRQYSYASSSKKWGELLDLMKQDRA